MKRRNGWPTSTVSIPMAARGKGLTVAQAVAVYLNWAKLNTVTAAGIERRAALHILPASAGSR